MLQVSIDVRGKRTLEESLDFYVQGELMEGENQYLCEGLGRKVGNFSPMRTAGDRERVQLCGVYFEQVYEWYAALPTHSFQVLNGHRCFSQVWHCDMRVWKVLLNSVCWQMP